jgi:hypothetical protein
MDVARFFLGGCSMNPESRRILAVMLAGVLAGCAAAPRQRPLPTKPIDQGADTISGERRALQGQWTLVSLDVATDDGRSRKVDAEGRLSFDEFANLSIEFRMSDAGIAALESIGVRSPNPVISTTGQASIDPAQHRITYVPPDAGSRAFDPALAASRANPFALERVRYYTLDDSVLTLMTRHDNGVNAATSRWRRAP